MEKKVNANGVKARRNNKDTALSGLNRKYGPRDWYLTDVDGLLFDDKVARDTSGKMYAHVRRFLNSKLQVTAFIEEKNITEINNEATLKSLLKLYDVSPDKAYEHVLSLFPMAQALANLLLPIMEGTYHIYGFALKLPLLLAINTHKEIWLFSDQDFCHIPLYIEEKKQYELYAAFIEKEVQAPFREFMRSVKPSIAKNIGLNY